MKYTLSIVGNPELEYFEQAVRILQASDFTISRQLAAGQAVEMHGSINPDQIEPLLEGVKIDWCLHKNPVQIANIMICDMDSTIIAQECVDELADLAGVGEQVKAITEAAMQGNLEFSHSLAERVEQLAGQSQDILLQCWNERISINAGAKTLIATMNNLGAKTALVSGGFTWFAKRVAEAVGFSEYHANELVIKDHKLTGNVLGPVLDGKVKLAHLSRLAQEQKTTCAIGDGANDLAMVQGADLGIAYRAKPVLQHCANGRIQHTDLTTALFFQGICTKQWTVVS